jgi:ApaG protein
MYHATTRNLRVEVSPKFVEEQSQPSDGRYFWAYAVQIQNLGSETVQLISRYWHITDETGHVDEVRGPGVVGATPVLKPGQSFRYTSGCPLTTPSGIMRGSYQMTTDAGEEFSIEIPAFSLDMPNAKRRMN